MAMPAGLSPSNSPKSKLNRKTFPSPWTQVVRGGEEPDTASPRSPSASDRANFADCSSPPGEPTATEGQVEISDDNAAVSKKSAWKAVNGEGGSGPVMGAAWPTISESTRPSPKSSSIPSKLVSDGSISISQGAVISSAPQKQANATDHPHFTPSQKQPNRQRPMKRGGGAGGGSGQSGFARPPPPPPPPPFPIPFGNILPPMMELPIREPPYKGNNWETRPIGGIGSHSHMGNDHSSHRHSSRRVNFGSRRGDGVYHNGHGGKRDQDRDWNAPRNSTARDIHMHQLAPPPPPPSSRGFTRPALAGSTPFIPPQHVRPFGSHMAFDMVPPFLYGPPLPPESFRGVSLVALPPPSPPPPPPMFFPVADPNVRTLLLNQIDYYFSDANLVKDNFLRSNMDDQGWVPISLIASFPRVLNLKSNVQLILDTLGASTVVEVQGDKVRRRDDWRKWIPSPGQFPRDSGLQSPNKQTDNMLATSIEKLQLDDVTTNPVSAIDMEESHPEVVPGKFSFEEAARSKLTNGEDTAEAA